MKKVLLALGLGISALMSVNSFAADLQEGKQYVQVSQQASQQNGIQTSTTSRRCFTKRREI